jgi:glycyl-tRNA synthetase beta chain
MNPTLQPLLVELFTEELPPKALAKLGEALAAGIANSLKTHGLIEDASSITAYATPRRLAVLITQVRSQAPSQPRREKILPVNVALDANGAYSAPLIKKLAAMGLTHVQLNQLERAMDGKTESFFYSYTAPGLSLQHALQTALEVSVAKLPIPKLMTYQCPDGGTVQFARPVHRLVALHGEQIVDVNLLGLSANRITQGHRFLSEGNLNLTHANDYAEQLFSQGKVIASFDARKQKIRAELLAQAGHDQVLMPESLLDEVTALVEWPAVYSCQFEPAFLSVPQECLILTMQTNQKYFALTDQAGKLRSRFLMVSNIATATPERIIHGNETVVRPRLSDAKFFFEQDQKKPLAERVPGLAKVVYHNKLGNQLQRTGRVQQLAGAMAAQLQVDINLTQRATQLAKADLLTDMVGEFPELQGIMGSYYARLDGENEQVVLAITEHYQPRFAGDTLPSSPIGAVLALADKCETLVGIWGIGLPPTGDRDPFALRRHALGILRILIEKQLPFTVSGLIQQTAGLFIDHPAFTDPSAALMPFIYDRLRSLLKEHGYTFAEVEAVVAPQPDLLIDILPRLAAVQRFAALPESAALAAANKRIANILKKTDAVAQAVNTQLLHEKAERELFSATERIAAQVQTALAKHDFNQALQLLAAIRPEVDAFFNEVMVMTEDAELRANRIALLALLHQTLNQVADISKLAA